MAKSSKTWQNFIILEVECQQPFNGCMAKKWLGKESRYGMAGTLWPYSTLGYQPESSGVEGHVTPKLGVLTTNLPSILNFL